MDHSKSINKRNKIIILTSQTFTVTHSLTGTSGSNVMVQIEVNKKCNESCIEFPKKMNFSVNLNFWIESLCLSSEGKEFHTVGAAKLNERCQNVLVRSLGIH